MSLIELITRYHLIGHNYAESMLSIRYADAYGSSWDTYSHCMNILAHMGYVDKEWFI